MLHDQRRPHLIHDVRVLEESDAIALEYDNQIFSLTGLAEPALAMCAIDNMRGELSVAELANHYGVGAVQLGQICDALEAEGLAIFVDALDKTAELVDVSVFLAEANERFAAWKERVFSHPLWASLADGTAPRTVFSGWLIENYHFIEAVMLRLPLAITKAETRGARRHFSRHFREEYNHFHFFEQSLDAAGLPPHRVAQLRPLPGTTAVINHMRDCARRDSLSYAACSGFLESTGEDHERSRSFFALVSSHFDPPDRSIVKPLSDHAALDEEYGHCGMLELIAKSLGPISRARATQALADAYALVESLELWSTDIHRHYLLANSLLPGCRRYRPVAAYPESV